MIKILDFQTKTRNLTPEEQKAGENVCQNCMGIKPGEKVLIVTDTDKEKIEAPIFFESAKKLALHRTGAGVANKVKMLIMKPTGQHGAEAPKKVVELMCQADVVLIATTYSLSHTAGRKKASNKGVRIASMPGITKDTILRTLTIDYQETDRLSEKIADLLTKAKKAKLTSRSGTNIIFSLENRQAIPDVGINPNPGDFCNLPAGEALIAPVEGKSNGIIVFEKVYGTTKLNRPLKLKVKNGKVVSMSGPQAAKILANLEKIGPKAKNIAELGIGTNKAAKLTENILEIEKVYGTCHLALGNNITFGGEVDVPYHEDGIILNPTLKLDGKTIIKNSKFLT